MKHLIKICISLSFLLSVNNINGQIASDIGLARSLTPTPSAKPDYSYNYQGKNEAEELTALLFTGYKYFISSQDQRSCNFHPSCSVYAIETIQLNGMTVGFLDTFDRLTRCHPLSRDKYEINPKNGLALDPVQ
jgi:putative membrane protein insertion efficiency factor